MPYILGYAKLGTSKCKGPKPCSGSKIPKGSLRFGTQVVINGNTTFAWRHYGCITAKQFENIKTDFDQADEVDGFEDLTPEDQEKFRKAFAEGHVAEEDIPETARKEPELDEDGNPIESPKKGRGKGKKAKDADENGDADEKKPKKKAAPKKKASKAKDESEVESEEEVEEEKKSKKKATTKKRSAKKQPDSEEEEEEEEESKPKKTKKAPAKKRAAKKDAESDNEEPEEVEKPKKKGGRKPAAKKQKVEEESDEESV